MTCQGKKETFVMKNYFLTLTEIQKQEIEDAGVESCDLKIDDLTGTVVDEDNLRLTKSVLSSTIANEHDTSIEGIVRVELEPAEGEIFPPSPQNEAMEVISNWRSKWSDTEQDFIEATEALLMGIPYKKISLHGGNEPNDVKRLREKVVPPDTFQIIVWGSLVGGHDNGNHKIASREAFGFEMGGDWNWWINSGIGDEIINPDSGRPIAEIIENNRLFIFPPLGNERMENGVEIYRCILREVLERIDISPEERDERMRQFAEERLRKYREAYIQECSKRFKKTLEGTRNKIIYGRDEIEELQKRLSRKVQEVIGAERKLKQLEASNGEQLESYSREFDSLVSVPGVEDVRVSDGMIKVFTENIYIKIDDGDIVFDIGKFRMEIYTSGSNGGIRFFNITRQGNGGNFNTHHPHVEKNRKPCLGNISELVPQLIGEYEYSALAQLGLQFLKSVNLGDSAGEEIFEYWPKKGE